MRDELIEAMAEIEHARSGSWYPTKPPYEEVSEGKKQEYLRRAKPYVSVIVEFFSEWLLHDGAGTHLQLKKWRQDMDLSERTGG